MSVIGYARLLELNFIHYRTLRALDKKRRLGPESIHHRTVQKLEPKADVKPMPSHALCKHKYLDKKLLLIIYLTAMADQASTLSCNTTYLGT
jgi:hypothetical protein